MDSRALLNQISNYDKTRKSSADVLNEAMGKYGVPEIRSRVANLRTTLSNTENALNAVDPSVTGRTQGSLVTEAQRQRQVNNERAPIMQDYGKLSGALGNESQNLNTQESAARQLAEGSINDWTTGRASLQSRYDTTYSREQQRRAEAFQREQFQEQKRQAAAAEAAARRASSGGGFSFGGSSLDSSASRQASAPNPIKLKAIASVDAMLQRRDTRSFYEEVQAIAKSARYGNVTDKAKLQLLRAKQPGLFKPDGSLNNRRINALWNEVAR